MDKKKKIRVGVMGSTGLVGQQFVRMLSGHPSFEVITLTASGRSAGKRYGDAVEWLVGGTVPEDTADLVVEETSAESFLKKDVKIAFSALPSAVCRDIENELAEKGIGVFSNASAFRMDPEVPVLIPEVNPDHLRLVRSQLHRRRGFIIANSNCTTSGLVLALKPLLEFGIRRVGVATYQAVSGAGRRGLASLSILGNVIPFIKSEEEKIEAESRKILGTFRGSSVEELPLDIHASCCRVPVRDGHLESVTLDMASDFDLNAAREALASFQGAPQRMKLPTAPENPILVTGEIDRPQPVLDVMAGRPERAEGMAITVGRMRKNGRRMNFFLLVHNTIRGAAGTCILNAELALRSGYIT